MFSAVFGWLASGGLAAIGKQLNLAYKSKLDAKNAEDRIAADVTITTLEAQRDVLIAEQKHRITRLIRPLAAAPFIIFVWKVVVWDTVLGLGVTPPLSTQMGYLMMVIFGAYFAFRPFEKRK